MHRTTLICKFFNLAELIVCKQWTEILAKLPDYLDFKAVEVGAVRRSGLLVSVILVLQKKTEKNLGNFEP